MKKILIFLALSFCTVVFHLSSLNAQQAVLDNAAAKLKKDGGITIGFTISAKGAGSEKGTLYLQGKRFFSVMPDANTWFDGKNMWSLNKENNEVYITEPTASELSKVNPYYFLDVYKKGFTIAAGKSTDVYHEVLLTATDSKNSIQVAVVRINKKDNTPRYTKITAKNKNVFEITVNSYKAGKKFTDSSFRFNKSKYPKAEVIDLR